MTPTASNVVTSSPKRTVPSDPAADFRISIAEGVLKDSKHWQNAEYSWDDFCNNLVHPGADNPCSHIESKTLVQYEQMNSKARNNLKLSGRAFLGGPLLQVDNSRSVHRCEKNLLSRTLLTFDIEDITTDQANSIILGLRTSDTALLWYTTFSSRTDNPRFRVVAPLSRPVSIEEYKIIVKQFARLYIPSGLDLCSGVPAQAMLYPHWLSDVAPMIERRSGKPVDPDALLASVHASTDNQPETSPTPASMTAETAGLRDPRWLKGLPGTFNKAYDVRQAAEVYLQGILIPEGDRYRRADADSAAGICVFGMQGLENAFLYSHHSGDPVPHRPLDAFTAVRVYKFGHLDANVPNNTRICRLPSYHAMEQLAGEDPNIDWTPKKPTLHIPHSKLLDAAWKDELIYDEKSGRAKASEPKNIFAILRNDDILRDAFGMNLMSGEVCVLKRFPWLEGIATVDGDSTPKTPPYTIQDDDIMNVIGYISANYTLGRLTLKDMTAYIGTVAADHKFHPVTEYLNNLPDWDSTPRLEQMLQKHLGAADTVLTQEAALKWAVGAIARAYEPGCKFDNILIFQGPQGIGKSRFLQALGAGFFTDNTGGNIKDKDTLRVLNRSWIIEFAELGSLISSRTSEAAVKAFLSRQVDELRVPYAVNPISLPRPNVCAGTTNSDAFLKDNTGNRRFWIIPLSGKKKFVCMDAAERDQLWAEALHYYRDGCVKLQEDGRHFFDLSPEAESLLLGIQGSALVDQELEDDIRSLLNEMVPSDWNHRSMDDWVTYQMARPLEQTVAYQMAKGCSSVDSAIHLIEPFGTYHTDYDPEYIRQYAPADMDTRLVPRTRIDVPEIVAILKLKNTPGISSKVRDILMRLCSEKDSCWEKKEKRQRHGTAGGRPRIVQVYDRKADSQVADPADETSVVEDTPPATGVEAAGMELSTSDGELSPEERQTVLNLWPESSGWDPDEPLAALPF